MVQISNVLMWIRDSESFFSALMSSSSSLDGGSKSVPLVQQLQLSLNRTRTRSRGSRPQQGWNTAETRLHGAGRGGPCFDGPYLRGQKWGTRYLLQPVQVLKWSQVFCTWDHRSLTEKLSWRQKDREDRSAAGLTAHGPAGVDLLTRQELLQLPDVHRDLGHDLWLSGRRRTSVLGGDVACGDTWTRHQSLCSSWTIRSCLTLRRVVVEDRQR